jgi:hypothetical protein
MLLGPTQLPADSPNEKFSVPAIRSGTALSGLRQARASAVE